MKLDDRTMYGGTLQLPTFPDKPRPPRPAPAPDLTDAQMLAKMHWADEAQVEAASALDPDFRCTRRGLERRWPVAMLDAAILRSRERIARETALFGRAKLAV